jgi:glutathione S-transferase
MLLYNSQVSGNCYKVRLLLAQLGIAYERLEVDVVDRSNRGELLGDLNPALRVPTIVLDDGRSLGESGAILWYFAEGTPLVPADPFERAQALQWMFFEQYELEPNVAVARFLLLFDSQGKSPEFIADKSYAGRKTLAKLEAHLRGRQFVVGDRYSIADVALYGYTHVAADAAIELADYPAIGAWLERVAAQPGHVAMAE